MYTQNYSHSLSFDSSQSALFFSYYLKSEICSFPSPSLSRSLHDACSPARATSACMWNGRVTFACNATSPCYNLSSFFFVISWKLARRCTLARTAKGWTCACVNSPSFLSYPLPCSYPPLDPFLALVIRFSRCNVSAPPMRAANPLKSDRFLLSPRFLLL